MHGSFILGEKPAGAAEGPLLISFLDGYNEEALAPGVDSASLSLVYGVGWKCCCCDRHSSSTALLVVAVFFSGLCGIVPAVTGAAGGGKP